MEKVLKDALDDAADLLHQQMDDLLPKANKGRVGEGRLAEAMRYSSLSGGKRLRPFLVITSASLFGVSKRTALQVAAAVEFIHAYSLIHDDLPALDNDDMRRGQPSCHKKFDEATAILAGDALLTFAFEIVSHPATHSDSMVRAELVYALSQASGIRGMIGGQMIDLISERKNLSIEEITRLQRMKTGALFAVSCEAGAILGKAPRNLRNSLRGYAHDIGLAFQITDDLLDAEMDKGAKKEKRKNKRQNKSSGKGTYVSAMGVEKARQQAKILSNQAMMHLNVFGHRPEVDILKELARYMVERER